MESIEQGPQYIDLFSPEFENKIKTDGVIYRRKIEPIKNARQATAQETIETRLPDGTLETTQTTKFGDWVITGSKGEEFVFTASKFNDLYQDIGNGQYVPRERKIIAILNPFKKPIRITPPWSTMESPAFQDGNADCMIAVEIDSESNMTKDRYIIGNEEMLLNNYELAS